ncbi:MAG: nickel-dependent hydrogenase large subunit [Candidatus Competibacter phosphatis]|uniref:Hydrogenase 2 large subunit n=1 Tax=Candidatus Competibacter phosphatis TaxID=221280 RepID=A0ABX1TIV8_9GAMM|nr:nickel-dependent hydrogenase large subunit [Candidatus Competibacter phosphatis]NMQ17931.1 hydrogenase 2 large subunit [Candidatus Competibacter phosphatis]
MSVARITIDPITRIEGHLRIDCEVNNGKVSNAWSSGQMWRGIEIILQGRDPRDAWLFTQRICGVCTTVHAIVSVRAVENALDLEVPLNAQYIRNMIVAAHGIHDHIVHFYQLAALDWVDIVSALSASPEGAAKLGASLSDYRRNGLPEIRQIQEKLKAFVGSGQLGVFASGYWGHPAMKLPPEVNLLAATHYLQALEYQRIANRIVAILGSKTPHIQNLAVGGVANPINPDSQSTLTLERLFAIKAEIDKLGEFVNQAMIPDVAAVGALYADWTRHGAGVTDYLSVPDLPLDTKGTQFELPGGYVPKGDLSQFKPIASYRDAYFRDGVKESVKHAWYQYKGNDAARHPYEGQTHPHHTAFQDDGKYSWVKAPTFYDQRVQVGPLANVLAMVAAGHEPTQRHLKRLLDIAGAVAGSPIPVEALHSTIGRIAARAVRCAVLLESLQNQWQLLINNIAKGDFTTFNRPVFPKGEIRGFGYHEAPRGVLSHWTVIENGKIKNYQAVVPSTWNAGPRDDADALGPYEASLVDNPVADPELPLEVLRTVHSFDPCLACAIHLTDTRRRSTVQVKAF